MVGPTPTSYFGLGRSEIDQEAAHKFDRQRRVLPGEMYSMKPDTNNVLFHKDKGRGVRHEIRGNRFSEGAGMPIEDPRKKTFPGPGQYHTQGKIDKTTAGIRSPAYSMPTAGQINVKRKMIDYTQSHLRDKNEKADKNDLSKKK